MTPSYNKVHLKFKLNGFHYSHKELKEVSYSFIKEGELYQQDLGNFLLDWLDENDFVRAKTSGSTGKPKNLKIKKQAMVNSALATGDFFNLTPGDKVLLCLPAQYIAGKMMLVRAMILGLELDLIEPKSKLDFSLNRLYAFCAMIPLQLQNNLENIINIKTIIIGGSVVSNELKKAIQGIKTDCYETYGMTETVTHIAVKKLNNFKELHEDSSYQFGQPYFKTLPNISISKDKRGCLVINAPKLTNTKVRTNDIIRMHSETEFEWLGRFDNVINSGGVKLFPEQIEAKLKQHINQRFFITSEPHKTLGNKVVLILEADSNQMDTSIFNCLSKFEKPKKIYAIKQFKETISGKIQRKKTTELLNF